MPKVININIADKRPTVEGAPVIVCGNSDYSIAFTFDAEWSTTAVKTARFVWVQSGNVKHQDADFTGNTVKVPALSDTTKVKVGVYQGELQTTTPAVIPCELSILCGSGEPAIPTPEQDARIMELLNMAIDQQAQAAAAAQEARDAATQAPPIICTATGTAITVTDCADRAPRRLSVYGKTSQEGTPTPSTLVPLTNLADAGSITVGLYPTEAAGAEAAQAPQTVTVQTPTGLPSIGQTCDEIDLARGVYIQRVAHYIFDGSADENWYLNTSPTNSYSITCARSKRQYDTQILSNYGTGRTWSSDANKNSYFLFVNLYAMVSIGGADVMAMFPDLAAFKAHLAANPLELVYELETPVERPLSYDELADGYALRMNSPTTTVLNDAGAEMALDYVADTKLYIDNKFAAMAASLTTTEEV